MKFLFLAALLFFCSIQCMEHKETQEPQSEAVYYDWPVSDDDTDIIDHFLNYVENLDSFEKEVAIMRLSRWLENQDYIPPQAIQFSQLAFAQPTISSQSLRFDN